jgi:hypothetical protein
MTNDFRPDQLFDNILNNLRQTGNIVDERYIKTMLSKWHIKDFDYNDDGNVSNKYAIKELEKVMGKLVSSIPQNVQYTIIGLNQAETTTAIRDQSCANTLFLCMFSFGIHRHFAKKLRKPDDDKEKIVFSNLTATMLENVKGIVFSYLSGDTLTVIQKLRIAYECCVIFWFINKHRELVEPFLEHIKIVEHKIFRDMPRYDNKKTEELKLEHDDDFSAYLGWTKNVIKEKGNRNLEYMAKDVGFENEMSLLYKLSSNYIHTNAYSAFIKDALDPNYVKIYLPLVSDMLINQISMFTRIVNDVKHENEMIGILLDQLMKTLFPDYTNTEELGHNDDK